MGSVLRRMVSLIVDQRSKDQIRCWDQENMKKFLMLTKMIRMKM